jgi:hypothetical protein
MGTKSSYTGGGGKPGKDLRQNLEDWLDSLPDPGPPPNADTPPDAPADPSIDVPRLRPEQLLPALRLFRPRGAAGHSDGPGGGGGTGIAGGGSGAGSGARGGAQRTVARSSQTAGRAAAAAYALRTGNAQLLQELGLDYDSLRNNPDTADVARQIMVAACGPLPDGTIEEDEQRIVAAQVALYVLEANANVGSPTPEEIVRETIAWIIFEAVSSETAAMLHNGERSARATVEDERQMRETAQALALRVRLPPDGPTPTDFSEAIAQGIETMHAIWGNG